jgi:hypothetical protein
MTIKAHLIVFGNVLRRIGRNRAFIQATESDLN